MILRRAVHLLGIRSSPWPIDERIVAINAEFNVALRLTFRPLR